MNFQTRVAVWMYQCFSPVVCKDKRERAHRFFEEATELVQAAGISKEDCLKLVEYTYNRPIGEKTQEVGGVMVTLAAMCSTENIDMHNAGENELFRINRPDVMERIRAKQAAKPKFSPLPEVVRIKHPAEHVGNS